MIIYLNSGVYSFQQQLLLSTSPSQTTNELSTTQDIRDAHENESAPQNSTIDPGQTTTQTEDNRIDHERESGPQNPTIRDHLTESTIFHVRIDPLYLFYLTGKFFNIYPKWIGTDHIRNWTKMNIKDN